MPSATEVMTQWMASTAEDWKRLTEPVEEGDQLAVVGVVIARDQMDIAFLRPPSLSQDESMQLAGEVLTAALGHLMFGQPVYVHEQEPDAE